MSDVSRRIRLPVEATTLWDEIGSFSRIAEWHPMLAAVESQGDEPGSTRVAYTRDGHITVERLQSVDPLRHAYRYTMEASVMPIENYQAEFRIDANDDESSTVEWSAHFDLLEDAEAADTMVDAFLEAGIYGLQKRYGMLH